MYASLIPGIIFGFIGLYIIYWFSKIILSQFFGPFSFKDMRNKRIVGDASKALDASKRLLEEQKVEECLERLKGAFIFHSGPFSYEMISMITNQHLACLQFLLDISDRTNNRLEDLPILEELVHVRAGMLKAYADTVGSLRKLAYKRDTSKAPAWAKNEFKAKQKELIGRLEDNIQSIKKVYVSIGTALTSKNQHHDYH
ncbi:MAG: hypothetical protein KDD62_08280 [Bdellovibrionales bacterium]|nr:hypothetical protein [Bdellovibrionales bacterium]